MKKNRGRVMSLVTLVGKLLNGGWVVDRDFGAVSFSVSGASFSEMTLKIEHVGGSLGLAIDDPVGCVVEKEPWLLEVHRNVLRRQQRKQAEGGGWHEVPVDTISLRLKNPELEKIIKEQREEQLRRREEERVRREAEQKEARRQKFLAELTAKFVGKKVVGFETEDDGLILKFENGSDMRIGLDGGDIWDAFATVNGISLRSYRNDDGPVI